MSERAWKLRGPKPTDLAWVVDTWLRSYRQHHCDVDHDSYFAAQRKLIEGLIPQTLVVIACDPEDEDHVFGWACVKDDVVHYVYVKHTLRSVGVATDMLRVLVPGWKERDLWCSHRPKNRTGERDFAKEMLRRWRLRFNPWLAQETHTK